MNLSIKFCQNLKKLNNSNYAHAENTRKLSFKILKIKKVYFYLDQVIYNPIEWSIQKFIDSLNLFKPSLDLVIYFFK